jgi:hypothetical protein
MNIYNMSNTEVNAKVQVQQSLYTPWKAPWNPRNLMLLEILHNRQVVSPIPRSHLPPRKVFLNRRAAARCRALASIIPGRER